MPNRPNILFLMSDHTNAAALAAGSQCITPNLDALAAEGTRFGRCYTTNAICSPARASLMTSLYPSSHGMWDCTHTQRPEWVDVPASRFTYFSQCLADAGYHNGYFGKWHVEQSGKLEDFGWHEYDAAAAKGKKDVLPGSEVIIPKEGYNDYRMAAVADDPEAPHHPAYDKGIEFLQAHTQRNKGKAGEERQPFCCFVSSSEPHDPYIPPRRFFDMYDLDVVDVSTTLHDDIADKPDVVKRLRQVWEGMTDEDWQRTSAAYWAVITFLDSEVGRILAALRETGEYDNTIIVFTSDHGDMLGAHGLATKGIGTAYEEVYNIPLILRVPGTEAGGDDMGTLTSLVDLAPTLLDLCGLDPLPDAQGRSLRPVVEGTVDAAWRDAYAEFFGQRFVYTQRIVWHEDWKYIFSPGGIDELYNLADDPLERVNLAGDAGHRDVLLSMVKHMWRKMRDIGDTSLFNTQYATLRTAPIGPGAID